MSCQLFKKTKNAKKLFYKESVFYYFFLLPGENRGAARSIERSGSRSGVPKRSRAPRAEASAVRVGGKAFRIEVTIGAFLLDKGQKSGISRDLGLPSDSAGKRTPPEGATTV